MSADIEDLDVLCENTRKRPRFSSGKSFMSLYNNITELAKGRKAPVDEFGCEVLPQNNVSPKEKRFQVLISLMLSSQTKDHITAGAVKRLQAEGCTPERMIELGEDKVGELIYPVGFWRRKASYIITTSQTLIDEYNSDIPDSLEGLVKLKGVGDKMALLAMNVGWEHCVGIAVDVHVHRVSNRLGWVKTKTPAQTRTSLEKLFPEEYWPDFNLNVVGFGQTVCLPRGPKCSGCINEDICPKIGTGGVTKRKKKSTKKKIKKSLSESQQDESNDSGDETLNEILSASKFKRRSLRVRKLQIDYEESSDDDQ